MTFPPDLLARYDEPAEIGAGGMGRVYRVTDKATLRPVAVKLLSAELSLEPEMRARFSDEVRMARRVQHPNVVAVIDSGETAEGQLYMIAELVDGATLRKILDQAQRLLAPKVIGLGRALLSGLAAIHAAGIVHRDLKPANIMVDRQGTLKIIDFGIARDTAAKITRSRSGIVLGTPHYFAPEQVDNGTVKPATDVYAAGAILYEALSGQPPFPGTDFTSVVSARLTGEPPALDTLVPDIPRALARVVHQMLARRSDDRYADGREALSALKTASGDRSEAVRTLEANKATDPGESLVPARLTGVKIPVAELYPPPGTAAPRIPTPFVPAPMPADAPPIPPAPRPAVAIPPMPGDAPPPVLPPAPGPRAPVAIPPMPGDTIPAGPPPPRPVLPARPAAPAGPRPPLAPPPMPEPLRKPAAPPPVAEPLRNPAAPPPVPEPLRKPAAPPPAPLPTPPSGVIQPEDPSGDDISGVPRARSPAETSWSGRLVAGFDPGTIAIGISVALIGVVTCIALLVRLLR